MPRSSRQKTKLLYIAKYLLAKTDENHSVTVNDIISELARQGISAERKSVYDDIAALESFGLDICRVRSNTMGYYIGSRDFQTPELKLLVDAIQSSKFITTKKSMELIDKLGGLCSENDAKLLRRQVYVTNRVKTPNEKIYYSVDTLHNAILSQKQISFIYNEWVLDFGSSEKIKKRPRRGGELYRVSPRALCWDDENYYLIGTDEKSGVLKHYRVDKMESISILKEECRGEEDFEGLDLVSYTKSVFSMFGGEEQDVKLSVDNSLIGVIADRFGKNVFVTRESDSTFNVTLTVALSPQFYGWLFALGTGVRIVSPQSAAEDFSSYARGIADLYTNK